MKRPSDDTGLLPWVGEAIGAGTLAYMAPEQFPDAPHPLSAATEVYLLGGVLFLATRFVPGAPLPKVMARGPVSLAEALPVVAQLVSGLKALHERGFVHRDLQPGNVMLDDQGRVTLLDLGLALAERQSVRLRRQGQPEQREPARGTLQGALDHSPVVRGGPR